MQDAAQIVAREMVALKFLVVRFVMRGTSCKSSVFHTDTVEANGL